MLGIRPLPSGLCASLHSLCVSLVFLLPRPAVPRAWCCSCPFLQSRPFPCCLQAAANPMSPHQASSVAFPRGCFLSTHVRKELALGSGMQAGSQVFFQLF